MPQPITFWFDFASPYAYFARRPLAEIAARHGRPVIWRPMLLWAVLKAQGIAAPPDARVRWDYLMRDMERSARFFGVPYRHPKLPATAHVSMWMFYALTETRPQLAEPLMDAIFTAHMADGVTIGDAAALRAIAGSLGIAAEDADAAMTGPRGRELLAAAVEEAVAAGVIGSPFTIVDGEGFFGADRLPQIEWRLRGAAR